MAAIESDANPLFAASLPNRFVAILPAGGIEKLIEDITKGLQDWAKEKARDVLSDLWKKAGLDESSRNDAERQIEDQLRDFPEVYWASVPWSLITQSDGKAASEQPVLKKALSVFYPTAKGSHAETIWKKIEDQEKGLIKSGERLCALCALKRFWPKLFVKRLEGILPSEYDIRRYIVSTHTLALSTPISKLIENISKLDKSKLTKLSSHTLNTDPVALPRSLHFKLKKLKDLKEKGDRDYDNFDKFARRLPRLLDDLRDKVDAEDSPDDAEEQYKTILKEIEDFFDNKPETYYAAILMEGDKMGAWVAGNEEEYQLKYKETWHRTVRKEAESLSSDDKRLKEYLESKRPSSPARHMAISGALNNFSLNVARFIVEDCYKGKLIYSGGDDLLALVCVDDLLPVMFLLRLAYSGIEITDDDWRSLLKQKERPFEIKKGYIFFKNKKKLMIMMGEKATASIGAVVAHHQAPLQMVLRELRRAEKQAKKEGGRNAFSIRILKRSGGEIGITAEWWGKEEQKRC